MADRPVLILEGKGDCHAVPELIRRISQYAVLPCPRPLFKQNIKTLSRPGELERFVTYAASKPEGDSVLIVLDTDEHCAVEVASDWCGRISALNVEKRVAVCFFVKEFEALFLSCLDKIMERYPNYGWNMEVWDENQDPEAPRGAKDVISNTMSKGLKYKETVDQVKFVSALDLAIVRQKCRAFRHLESVLVWLRGDTPDSVYPVI